MFGATRSRSIFAQAPHDQLVVARTPEMGETKFVRWTISGSDGRPSWKEALKRLT